VNEYAKQLYANSTKTAYTDPRELIGLLSRALNDSLPPVYASTCGHWTPRVDETDKLLTEGKQISSID
jgi:hypothetical protein